MTNIYVFFYIYICTHICVYIYTYIYIHIYICIYNTYINICIYIYIYLYICTYKNTYLHVHLHVNTHMYTHIWIYVYVYVYIYSAHAAFPQLAGILKGHLLSCLPLATLFAACGVWSRISTKMSWKHSQKADSQKAVEMTFENAFQPSESILEGHLQSCL